MIATIEYEAMTMTLLSRWAALMAVTTMRERRAELLKERAPCGDEPRHVRYRNIYRSLALSW